jgi:RHS repeat-associated protein
MTDFTPVHAATACLRARAVGPTGRARSTSRLTYDLWAFFRGEGPVWARTEHRETHGDPQSQWFTRYAYSSGDEIVQEKVQAEPGVARQRDANGEWVDAFVEQRWVGTGRVIRNNKGDPIKQYEPFFSATEAFEDEAEMIEQGVTPLLHYDPLGRLIRVDGPDGTVARVEFDAWSKVSFDPNDTVLESAWRERHTAPEAPAAWHRAANLTEAHADTLLVEHVDVLGRVVASVAHDVAPDGSALFATTRVDLDILGNPLRVDDARGNVAERRVFGMLGQSLQVHSVDAGSRRTIADVLGAPLLSFDARGFVKRARYDAARRPTEVVVTPPGGQPFVALRTVYGETADDAAARCLRGRVLHVYDASGQTANVEYDFEGNLRAWTRRLARRFDGAPDWSILDGASEAAAVADLAEAELETETFAFASTYDALGRVTSHTTPDGAVTFNRYNRASLLEGVDVRLRESDAVQPVVVALDYNARGQRLRCEHGNGTTTSYTYERETFRLSRLLLQREGASALQDLRYTYDPVGNVVEIADRAQQQIFFRNAVVSADQRFEYSAVYRLTRAEGREHAHAQRPTHSDVAFAAFPDPGDPAARTYVQTYAWDRVGNLERMQHTADGGDWTRNYVYADDGNRLLQTSAPTEPGGPSFTHAYAYDAHGNMTSMPHLSALDWNHADELQHADLEGGGDVWFVYSADGTRVRKVRVNGSGARAFERVYLGAYEVYRERAVVEGELQPVAEERRTLHLTDETGRICLVETQTVVSGVAVSAGSQVDRFRYQHGNHLGSTALELDDSAAIISYEEFHPFGTTAYAANDSGIEVSAKRYRYIGKERDDETGLYHCGARYLAAWLGRWTAADPIGIGDGVNRYAYAGNRPIGSRDATGNAEDDVLRELELLQADLILQAAQPGAATPERLAELEGVTAEIVEEQEVAAARRGLHAKLEARSVGGRKFDRMAAAREARALVAGTPRDAIERRNDPTELRAAELDQLKKSAVAGAGNRAFIRGHKLLEDRGVVAPISDTERRVRGLAAGEALDIAVGLGAAGPRGPKSAPKRRDAAGAAKGGGGGTETSTLPDFVVGPEGTAVPTSQAQMRAGFERAGFPGRPTTQREPGQIHTVDTPHGPLDVRTMEGGPHHPRRAITTRGGTNDPTRITGERFRANEPRPVQRAESHLRQKP